MSFFSPSPHTPATSTWTSLICSFTAACAQSHVVRMGSRLHQKYANAVVIAISHGQTRVHFRVLGLVPCISDCHLRPASSLRWPSPTSQSTQIVHFSAHSLPSLCNLVFFSLFQNLLLDMSQFARGWEGLLCLCVCDHVTMPHLQAPPHFLKL